MIDQEALQSQNVNIPEQDEEDVDEKRHFNKFQLLDLDGEIGDSEVEVDEDQSQEDNDEIKHKTTINNPHKASKSRSKKNRRRKAKNKVKDELDELDYKQLVNKSCCSNHTQEDQTNLDRFGMLKLDMRNLIPENEIKRIFGKSVLRDEKAKDKNIHHTKVQRSRFVSSGLLELKLLGSSGIRMDLDDLMNQQYEIKTKENSGPKQKCNVCGGLPVSRSTVNRPSNSKPSIANRPTYYRFVHDKSYREAQISFFEAVQGGHPESIVQNLNLYPLHAESHLQMSHMIRAAEDFKTASEFVERAILLYERSFHPRFNPSTADCRLTYRRPENRTFFITIFKHITYCHRRGLRRTPLEYTKMLLSLEPENDPLFAIQLLDFFAIRSEEYDFLIEFISKWPDAARLPNMKFSLALAYFFKSRVTKKPNSQCDHYRQLADTSLQGALLLFPNFIMKLLDACSGEPSDELKKCTYFDYSVYGTKYKLVPETLDVLINVYVKRNFSLWKTKHVMTWLEQNVATLVARFSSGELQEKDPCADWMLFKTAVPRNLLRHIVLSDLDMKIPESASNTAILDIDPFPPTESIVSYEVKAARNENSSQQSSHGVSSLFFRSLFPVFDSNQIQGRNFSTPTRADLPGMDNMHEAMVGDFVPDEYFDQPQARPETDELEALRNLVSRSMRLTGLAEIFGARNQDQSGDSHQDQGNQNRDDRGN